MVIGILILEFQLPGCRSLKEKRRRLSGVRDRFGRQPNVAICESGLQDSHQRAEWTYVVAASDRPVVEQTLAQIERYILDYLDAYISRREIEFL